jgi:hypothetical protein
MTKCNNCGTPLDVALPDDTSERTAEIVSRAILCDACKPSANDNAQRGTTKANHSQTGLDTPSYAVSSGDPR